ncbi:hypothetical protein, conserved [Leishmania tarentolae]|uniref:Uncharacterized protein n=1 Tax=Leishmania tarentolae TaxID=5689 RepID=A0A640KT55_LEITA|nr:hypothetical protein, conserved [Leishmania tarentolae]
MNTVVVTTPRMRVIHAHLACGLFFVLCLLYSGAAGQVVTQPWYKINYNTPAYVLYKPEDVVLYATSRAAANGYCMQNGMSIFSAELPAKDDIFAADAAKELGGTGFFTFTGSSGEPAPSFTSSCTQLQPDISVLPNSIKCAFSFRFGLLTILDAILLGNQTGVLQYYSLYPGVESAGNANTGFPVEWDTTNRNPRGYYFMAVKGLTATSGRHINVDAVVTSTDPYVSVPKFAIYCESQSFLGYVPVPSVLSQPSFVKGYKELTWAQEHWWIIFLILAVLILIVLLAILIYCCITMAPPKPLPPIAPMVLREHNGAAYVNVLDAGSPKPHSAADIFNPRSFMTESCQQVPSILAAPRPMIDPDDLIQAASPIFVQEEKLQTADGDCLASQKPS